MLLVTDQAAAMFRDILARNDVEGNSIRLAPEVGKDGTARITIIAIDEPRESDAPTQADGVDVYVAPELASDLEDSILDTEGDAGGTRLVVRPAA
jgi:Fe-S cluster assembly iron-binding protein IscA